MLIIKKNNQRKIFEAKMAFINLLHALLFHLHIKKLTIITRA